MSTLPIYMDYAATTPLDPRVLERMQPWLGQRLGNAASAHSFGRQAHAAVERARAQLAALIGAPETELVWTSGATESNNLALLGVMRAQRGHVITSRTEHKSVLDPCRQLEREGHTLTYLEPDREGLISPARLQAALRDDTRLVSIMHVNNETGVAQDIAALGAICRDRGVIFHVDGAQSVGRLAVNVADWPVDLLSISAHKLYGPQGIGALFVRTGHRAAMQPLIFGGGHERGLRSGTLPVHQIVGCGAACEVAAQELAAEGPRVRALRDRLYLGLADLPDLLRNGHATQNAESVVSGRPGRKPAGRSRRTRGVDQLRLQQR